MEPLDLSGQIVFTLALKLAGVSLQISFNLQRLIAGTVLKLSPLCQGEQGGFEKGSAASDEP
jgi:hypothetical protein